MSCRHHQPPAQTQFAHRQSSHHAHRLLPGDRSQGEQVTVHYLSGGFCAVNFHCLLVLLSLFVGCQSTEDASLPVPRRILMRSSPPQTMPGVTPKIVGLVVQSDVQPAQMNFARRVTSALTRELELGWVPVQVHCCTEDELMLLSPELQHPVEDIVTVSLQEPLPPLPPRQPSQIAAPMPPLLSQVIVVRVVEYRPYFPMRATATVTVLDAISQLPLYSTTAAWDALRRQSSPCDDEVDLHKYFFAESTPCDPSVIHNSPEFLAQIMAQDISQWYCMAVTPPIPVVVEEDRQ